MSRFCDRFAISQTVKQLQHGGIDVLNRIDWLNKIQPYTLDWMVLFSELNYYLLSNREINDETIPVWFLIERLAWLHREKGITVFFDDERWTNYLQLSRENTVKLPAIHIRCHNVIYDNGHQISSFSTAMAIAPDDVALQSWTLNEIKKLIHPGWLTFIGSPFYKPEKPPMYQSPVYGFQIAGTAGQVVQRRLRPERRSIQKEDISTELHKLSLHESNEYNKKDQ